MIAGRRLLSAARRRVPVAGIVTAMLLASCLTLFANGVKVTPVVASDGRLLISFSSPWTFNEDARTIVKSGLVLRLTYTIELRRPSLWLDPILAAIAVAADAKFDPLKRTYQVSRFREGQVVSSDKVEQESQVREWLTQFDNVLLEPSSPLVVNDDYYVRVRLRVEPRGSFSVWPFRGDDASGRAEFTFIKGFALGRAGIAIGRTGISLGPAAFTPVRPGLAPGPARAPIERR